MRRPLAFTAVVATAVATASVAVACARNPVTGKSEISLVSESQEIAMGQEAAQQVQQSIGYYDDPELQAYVARLGKELAAKSERPNLPWEFHVVDDAAINAFAIPGGFIYVTRGILAHMNDESELVSVLGHEIGHVTARHSVQQISQQQLATLGLGIGSILSEKVASVAGIASQGLGILFLKYGRDAEKQADELGFRYMVNGGYDPRGQADMFRILEASSKIEASAGRLPEWLSTHPNPENRVAAAVARIDTLKVPLNTLRRDTSDYIPRIEGIVFGEDPRKGYFEGNIFYHPELRFQITFPADWQRQNLPQAVVAASPQQDAILQLGIAGQGTADQAAQQFFAQEGLQSQDVQRTTINGLPAVAGYFQAQTEQGAVQGLATFVTYGKYAYQFLGYTQAGGLQAHDAVFRQTFGSFRELNDQSKIDVQPAKVELVRLPRAMTVQEFNQQYPSSVPIEQLAVMNGVAPDGRFDSGRTVKRVVGGVRN